MNEYIEISKYYSTAKSKLFVNGLLDNAVKNFQKEGKIKKVGRGLV
jgi:N utilization substance protein B